MLSSFHFHCIRRCQLIAFSLPLLMLTPMMIDADCLSLRLRCRRHYFHADAIALLRHADIFISFFDCFRFLRQVFRLFSLAPFRRHYRCRFITPIFFFFFRPDAADEPLFFVISLIIAIEA
jgi:hypothetical protein